MDFQNEWKHAINRSDLMIVEYRLSLFARPDAHAFDQGNCIHGLYFDDPSFSTALSDKCGRASLREKFRIVYYDDDLSLIRLEKKSEMNGMSCRESCEVTREFVEMILNRKFKTIVTDPMGHTGEEVDPLIQEFYWKTVGNGLHPIELMDFERKSYVYSYGDVRITMDHNFRSSRNIREFLNPYHQFEAQVEDQIIIGVKWKNYFPDVVKSSIMLQGRTLGSYPGYEVRRAVI